MLQLTLNLFPWWTPSAFLIISSDSVPDWIFSTLGKSMLRSPRTSSNELPVDQISRDSGKACSGDPMWTACHVAAVAAGGDGAGGPGGSCGDDDIS